FFSRAAKYVCVFVVIAIGFSTFQVAKDRDLIGTLSYHEMGRYLFAVGAAITQSRYGIGGFVADGHIEVALMSGGLSNRPSELDPLGISFPDNLRDRRLLQRALTDAREVALEPPPNGPREDGRYPRLHGSEGNDPGLVTYVRLGFALFGFSLSS